MFSGVSSDSTLLEKDELKGRRSKKLTCPFKGPVLQKKKQKKPAAVNPAVDVTEIEVN